ncbi:NDR1/HIN1-like protein 10 [Zingiber officinale]|uniref:Late embryogenesis abundant protein LEA-2 subgroup domain-containing protein n=1 Tax=Zingiber officinale TaxID=94328 RepID=A0A8J5EWC7_ZINOF|nr:NDR1/HIN1-like protein 10 [Zingiber officinale]KAG6475504.1 hypothetical protein ZIOFF_064726 [Zingiber officinale]
MSSSAGNPKTAVVTGYPNTAVVIGCPVPASGSNGSPLPRHFYPPPPPPPPAYAPPPPRSRYTTICIFLTRHWNLAMGVFMALVFLAVVIIIPVLFLVPRMSEFAVSSACVTGFNLSSAQQQQLSASFDLNLTVHSPNRLMRIYYEQVTASVVYASDILSENTLAPFDQGKGETTVLRVRLAVVGEYVNSDVARGIESDRGRDGAVGFNVRVFSWVIFRSGARTTRWSILSVHCDDVLIGFGNGTASTGCLLGSAPKKCIVISDSK